MLNLSFVVIARLHLTVQARIAGTDTARLRADHRLTARDDLRFSDWSTRNNRVRAVRHLWGALSGSGLSLCRNLCSSLLWTRGYNLRLRLRCARSSLSLRLLGGSLGLLRDLSSSLLWTGGYDLRGSLCRLGTGLSGLSLSLRLLRGSLGLCRNLSSGLLGAGGYDLRSCLR